MSSYSSDSKTVPATKLSAGDVSTAPTQTPNGVSVKGRSGQNLDVRDALRYLEAVKAAFADEPEGYDLFLDIMKDFKARPLGVDDVLRRVGLLFEGKESLIEGFEPYLPAGYSMYSWLSGPQPANSEPNQADGRTEGKRAAD